MAPNLPWPTLSCACDVSACSQGLSNTIWGLAVLRHHPGEPWLQAFLQAAEVAVPFMRDKVGALYNSSRPACSLCDSHWGHSVMAAATSADVRRVVSSAVNTRAFWW